MREGYDKGDWTADDSPVTSMSTDPSAKVANRINIVFVGDGYTTAELAQYKKDVDSNIAILSSGEPFKEYLTYFNFHRVDVVSKQSGVSEAVKGVDRNSALGMSYYCSGIQRLLCINASKAAKAAANAPAVDTIFALANSDVYGGAGYRSPAISTLAARNPAATELALHEFGHSFALLGDEYEYQGTGSGCASMPNVASDSSEKLKASQTKWYRWLDLPNVDTYKGSCYSLNFYRPTQNSKMRSLGRPFEEVNAEQMVLSIYRRVHPVDSSTPEGTLKGNQVISVVPMRPSGHRLSIVWNVDGNAVDWANDVGALDTARLNLASRHSYKITATVVDRTSAVRDEAARAQLMTQTLKWKLKL